MRRGADHGAAAWASLVLLVGMSGSPLPGAAPAPDPPDQWLTNGVHSRPAGAAEVQAGRFAETRAECVAGLVRVLWTPPDGDAGGQPVLHLSAGEPGHWPARDWHPHAMNRRGPHWEAVLPVDSLDVPLLYYVETGQGEGRAVSPLRLCRPRLLGLEQPTRVFWPFLEGFEEGLESWRWLAGGPQEGRLTTSAIARSGKAALAVRVARDKASATVATTRPRGWAVLEHGTTGLGLWMRTVEGEGRARFTLLAHAFSTNQVVAARADPVPVGSRWQLVELPFKSFGALPLGALDCFAIELLGRPGTEFLLDDLQWLGRWPPD